MFSRQFMIVVFLFLQLCVMGYLYVNLQNQVSAFKCDCVERIEPAPVKVVDTGRALGLLLKLDATMTPFVAEKIPGLFSYESVGGLDTGLLYGAYLSVSQGFVGWDFFQKKFENLLEKEAVSDEQRLLIEALLSIEGSVHD